MVAEGSRVASIAVADQLGRLRRQRGWTLAELADRTGLSAPFLSRLESGRRQPSLAALITLAKIYAIPLSELLDPGSNRGDEPVVVRGGQARIQRGNGLKYRPISGGEGASRLSALHVTVPRRRRCHALSKHEGEELLYVLCGTLVLTLDRQNHTLQAGDSAHFASVIPHRVAAVGEHDAEVLLVSVLPPEDADRRLKTGKPVQSSTTISDQSSFTPQVCIVPAPA